MGGKAVRVARLGSLWPAIVVGLVIALLLVSMADAFRFEPKRAAPVVEVQQAALLDPPLGGLVGSRPVGWSEGDFSVSHDGAAVYDLPLWLPDGRGGMRPELSLSYNSRGGNGLLGVGWSLSGLSKIEPCDRNLAQDGFRDVVHFDWSDARCLDGNRLVRVPSVTSPEEYRTERDTFAKIVAYGTQDGVPDTFRVWAKDGKVLTFGEQTEEVHAKLQVYPLMPGSDPSAPSLVRRSESRVTAAWLLNRIEDRLGNTVTIEWRMAEGSPADLWNGEVWPHAIHYAPSRTVRFYYEGRPDPIDAFKSGTRMRTSGRINRIAMYGRTGGQSELLREYRLGYQSNSITGRSLLSDVTECDHNGTCLMPLQFRWSLGSYDFDSIDTGLMGKRPSPGDHRILAGDVDGDGRDDILYQDAKFNWRVRYATGGGFSPSHAAGIPSVGSVITQIRPVDVDRDGRLDVMAQISPHQGKTEFYLYRATGSHDSPFVQYTPDIDEGYESFPWAPAYFADLDGNGMPEYATARYAPAVRGEVQPPLPLPRFWHYRLNTGKSEESDRFLPFVNTGRDSGGSGTIRVLDSDGDGRAELLSNYFKSGIKTVGLNKIGHLEENPLNVHPALQPSDLHFPDLNGDGLADAFEENGVGFVQLNSGNGLAALGPVSGQYEGLDDFTPYPNPAFDLGLRIVDFNNDGRQDIMVFRKGFEGGWPGTGIRLYVWRDAGFVSVPINRSAGQPTDWGWWPTQPLDWDGDGALDLVNLRDGHLQVLRRRGGVPDQLTRVQVGSVGPRVEVDYATLAKGGLNLTHLPANCTYPQVCPRQGGSVVSQHRLATGKVGSWNRFDHRYRGARTDVTGRGWLGFAQHTVIDRQTGTWTWTDFDNVTYDQATQTYPYAGLPLKSTSTVKVDEDTLYRTEVSYGYALRRFWGGRSFTVELTSRTKNEWEHAIGTPLPSTPLRRLVETFKYDNFGNKTDSFSAQAQGRKVTQQDYYHSDTANWLIGQLDRRVTTSCTTSKCSTRESTFGYYPNGTLKESVIEPTKPELLLRTVINRTPYGDISDVTVSDAAGDTRTEHLDYDDDWLYPTAARNALDHTTQVVFHSGLGVPLSWTDPNGVTTTYRYDWFGRLRETTGADGSFHRLDYKRGDTSPFTVETTGSAAPAGLTELDSLGREKVRRVRAFTGGWSSIYTTYDSLGRVFTVSQPKLEGATTYYTTYSYDRRNRLTSQTAPDGATIRHNYGGLQMHTYDAKGVHSYLVETPDGDVESRNEDDPNSNHWLQTRFEHGPFGELTKVVAPDQTTQTATYDSLGRRETHTDPSTGTSTSTWNAFGEMLTETDGAKRESQFIRDSLGRPKRVTSPDGVATYTWDTAVNGIGRLANSSSADDVSTRYTYDAVGHNSTTTWRIDGSEYQIDYGYDTVGRPSTITYPKIPGVTNRLTVAYAYDSSNAVAQVKNMADDTVYWKVKSRNAAGQLVREQFANGVVTTNTYDPTTGLLRRIVTTGPDTGDKFQDLALAYDSNRNVRRRNDYVSDRRETYSYDTLNRLRKWRLQNADAFDVNTTYSYDTIGNLSDEVLAGESAQTIIYRYGENGAPPHALTSRGNAKYGYDAAGRQTSGPNRTIDYNTSGLPTVLTKGSGQRTNFAYDADGARVLKRDAGQTVASVPGLFERRTSGGKVENIHHISVEGRTAAQVTFVQAQPGGPLTSSRASYLHTDQQSSTTLITDAVGQPQNTGSSQRALFYDPFGQRITVTNQPRPPQSGAGPSVGFTSHEHDDELGLINMKGRIYEPKLRRFLTPDPIVANPLAGQNHNRYSYVQNNPATLIDPTGFQAEDDYDRLEPNTSRDPTYMTGEQYDAMMGRSTDVVPAPESDDDNSADTESTGQQAAPSSVEGDYHGIGGYLHEHFYEPNQRDYAAWGRVGDDLASSWGDEVPIAGHAAGYLVGTIPAAAGLVGSLATSVLQFITPKTEEEHFLFVMTLGTGVGLSRAATAERGLAQEGELALGKHGNSVVRGAKGVGAESVDELVDLTSPAVRSHILDGEICPNGSYSGGHRAGTGFPGKSEFPSTWSDDQIIHAISDIATDPSAAIVTKGGATFATGTRGGVTIEVIIRGGAIRTGYPISVPRNP